MTKKCLLLGTYTFPDGMAASARMKNLAYGFRNQGMEVYIYSLAPGSARTESADEWLPLDENIYYHHYLQAVDAEKWKNLAKNPLYLTSLQYKSFAKLKKIIADKEFDFVFIYGRGFIALNQFFHYFNQRNIPIVFDVVELPAIYKNWVDLVLHPLRLDSVIGEHRFSKRASLISCITKAIQKRFPARKTCLLPGIENWNVTYNSTKESNNGFVLTYLGIFIEKDNPNLMYEFCKKLQDHKINFTIKIAGKYEGYTYGRHWKDQFVQTFKDKVIALGELNDKQLKVEVESSDALLLFRQDNESEENSFPTRLVEFLKTGKMVVTSPKGDLPYYLRHKHDAFLLPYNMPEEEIASFINIMQSTDVVTIGKNGFETGRTKFNRDICAREIMNHLHLSL